MPQPARNLPLVHRLVYTWDGWPTQGGPLLAAEPDFTALDQLWAGDGLRRLTHRWQPHLAQMTFEVAPSVAPVLFAARVKGRLDHSMRKAGANAGFSRKVGVRAIGANTDGVVQRYLSLQQVRCDLADPAYRSTLEEFSREYPDVRLDRPSETNSGRYWFNLHIVAVTNERWRMGREDMLPKFARAVGRWATGEGAGVRALAVMPDHIHLALSARPERSPQEVAESLFPALNSMAGCRLFSDKIYVGTFSAYTTGFLGL
jgi:Transposase IS200 like